MLTEAYAKAVEALKDASLTHRKAKDLLRASPAAPDINVHVAKDLEKVRNGEQLSPVLLVRGDASRVPRWSSPTATTGFAPATSSTRTPTSPVGWWTDRRQRTDLEADRAYLHPDALCRAARRREGVRQGGIVRRSHNPAVRAHWVHLDGYASGQ